MKKNRIILRGFSKRRLSKIQETRNCACVCTANFFFFFANLSFIKRGREEQLEVKVMYKWGWEEKAMENKDI